LGNISEQKNWETETWGAPAKKTRPTTSVNGTALKGPPNSWVRTGHTQWRYYGPDNKAMYDRDYSSHGGSHPNPHTNKWNWDDPEHPHHEDYYEEDDYPPLSEEPHGPPQPAPAPPSPSEFSFEPPSIDWGPALAFGTFLLGCAYFWYTGDPSRIF